MELFSLLAKLTLDSKEFDKGIDEAEKKGNFTIEDAKLGLDKEEFDSGIEQAQGETVDDMRPELGLDTDEFDEGVKKAQESSETFGGVVGDIFQQLKGAIVAAGIVGILTSVKNLLDDSIRLTAEYGDTVDKGAKAFQISNKRYQEWDHALKQSGASINDLAIGFKTMNKVLAGEGSEDAAKAYEALGLSADIASGKFKNSEELMEATFKAIGDYTGSDRGVIVNWLFGNPGKNLNAFFDEGSVGIQKLVDEASDLGLVMSDEEISNAVSYGDAMANLHAEMDALKQVFVADILPILTEVVKFITSILAFFNPRANKNSLADLLENVDKDFAKSIRNIDTMEGEAFSIVDQLQKMGDYTKLSADQQDLWNQRAERAIELFPQLSEHIDTDTHKIKGNTDEIKENIKQYGNMLKQRALEQAVADKNQILADKAAAAADKELEAEAKIDEAEGKRFAAIEEANRLLKLDQNASLAAQFYAKYGENALVTAETLDDFNTMAEENYNGTSIAFSQMLLDYDTLLGDAKRLKTEAEEANAEVEKEREHLERYTAIAAEKYGILVEDTDAITSKTETAAEKVRSLVTELNNVPKRVIVDFAFTGDTQIPFGSGNGMKMYTQAIGDPYVPYDNYPSLLHRGEMVLPATEARKYREGDSVSTDLEDRIIEAIQRGMSNAHVDAYMDGEKVTRSVSTRLARENGARRYNP